MQEYAKSIQNPKMESTQRKNTNHKYIIKLLALCCIDFSCNIYCSIPSDIQNSNIQPNISMQANMQSADIPSCIPSGIQAMQQKVMEFPNNFGRIGNNTPVPHKDFAKQGPTMINDCGLFVKKMLPKCKQVEFVAQQEPQKRKLTLAAKLKEKAEED